jgi:predicted restriction endonuclease
VSLADVTTDAVLAAMAEFDDLGRDDFLAKYQFGRARKFVLVRGGIEYDSKAIIGAAHQHATGRALPASTFSGGEQTVVARRTALGFDVRDNSTQPRILGAQIGEIVGVPIGTIFTSRREVADAGVHRALEAGIVGTAATGAESVVISGGYEDDEDHGTEIVYTGHGGRDQTGRQVADQNFDVPGNAALQTSCLTGAPVRVIRGAHPGSAYAPPSGYRYDGLFTVTQAWREQGRGGHLVCRFTMAALDTAPPVSLTEPTDGSTRSATPVGQAPPGHTAPNRRTAVVQRRVRSLKVAEYVKSVHDFTCQACGTRLLIGERAYAEGAHIRALGTPHHGPDIPANMLCLCPNCPILFDNGALLIHDDLSIVVNNQPISRLRTQSSHVINPAHIAYHRSVHR